MALLFLAPACSDRDEPAGDLQKVRVKRPIVIPARARSVLPPSGEKKAKKGEERITVDQAKTARSLPRDGGLPEDIHKPGDVAKDQAGESNKTQDKPKIRGGSDYIVCKGDDLVTIAARDEVYGDPLMWTILLWYNADKLIPADIRPTLPRKELPAGLCLGFLGADKARNRAKEINKDMWVVNVISSPYHRKLTSPAIALVKEGYPVYITMARVKGKDWLRLRVGFFNGPAEARKQGEKIGKIVGLKKLWYDKAARVEVENYGGYFLP